METAAWVELRGFGDAIVSAFKRFSYRPEVLQIHYSSTW